MRVRKQESESIFQKYPKLPEVVTAKIESESVEWVQSARSPSRGLLDLESDKLGHVWHTLFYAKKLGHVWDTLEGPNAILIGGREVKFVMDAQFLNIYVVAKLYL